MDSDPRLLLLQETRAGTSSLEKLQNNLYGTRSPCMRWGLLPEESDHPHRADLLHLGRQIPNFTFHQWDVAPNTTSSPQRWHDHDHDHHLLLLNYRESPGGCVISALLLWQKDSNTGIFYCCHVHWQKCFSVLYKILVEGNGRLSHIRAVWFRSRVQQQQQWKHMLCNEVEDNNRILAAVLLFIQQEPSFEKKKREEDFLHLEWTKEEPMRGARPFIRAKIIPGGPHYASSSPISSPTLSATIDSQKKGYLQKWFSAYDTVWVLIPEEEHASAGWCGWDIYLWWKELAKLKSSVCFLHLCAVQQRPRFANGFYKSDNVRNTYNGFLLLPPEEHAADFSRFFWSGAKTDMAPLPFCDQSNAIVCEESLRAFLGEIKDVKFI